MGFWIESTCAKLGWMSLSVENIGIVRVLIRVQAVEGGDASLFIYYAMTT